MAENNKNKNIRCFSPEDIDDEEFITKKVFEERKKQ